MPYERTGDSVFRFQKAGEYRSDEKRNERGFDAKRVHCGAVRQLLEAEGGLPVEMLAGLRVDIRPIQDSAERFHQALQRSFLRRNKQSDQLHASVRVSKVLPVHGEAENQFFQVEGQPDSGSNAAATAIVNRADHPGGAHGRFRAHRPVVYATF